MLHVIKYSTGKKISYQKYLRRKIIPEQKISPVKNIPHKK